MPPTPALEPSNRFQLMPSGGKFQRSGRRKTSRPQRGGRTSKQALAAHSPRGRRAGKRYPVAGPTFAPTAMAGERTDDKPLALLCQMDELAESGFH